MRTGLPFDDVLAAAQAGAAWAFEVLYRDLSPSVTGYLRLHGAAEPDDLASETFIGVFTGLRGFTGDEDALRGWVFTIAHRRLVDDWRRRSRRPQAGRRPRGPHRLVGGDVEDDATGPASGPTPSSGSARTLPDDQRSVILLRILADLTIEQVAQAMGRPWPRSRRSSGAASGRCAPGWRTPSKKSVPARTPMGRRGDDRGEMTTAADDSAVEAAFEAFLAGRARPGAGGAPRRVAAFAVAVRASATQPGRPNAALAELLATGLLTDQSARPPGRPQRPGPAVARGPRPPTGDSPCSSPPSSPSSSSAGAVAQAATGAGVVLVVATGAGATGLLPGPTSRTRSLPPSARTPPRSTAATRRQRRRHAAPPPPTRPGDGTPVEATVPVQPTDVRPRGVAPRRPRRRPRPSPSGSAGRAQRRPSAVARRGTGNSASAMVSHGPTKDMTPDDLADEGVDLADQRRASTTEPVDRRDRRRADDPGTTPQEADAPVRQRPRQRQAAAGGGGNRRHEGRGHN